MKIVGSGCCGGCICGTGEVTGNSGLGIGRTGCTGTVGGDGVVGSTRGWYRTVLSVEFSLSKLTIVSWSSVVSCPPVDELCDSLCFISFVWRKLFWLDSTTSLLPLSQYLSASPLFRQLYVVCCMTSVPCSGCFRLLSLLLCLLVLGIVSIATVYATSHRYLNRLFICFKCR